MVELHIQRIAFAFPSYFAYIYCDLLFSILYLNVFFILKINLL